MRSDFPFKTLGCCFSHPIAQSTSFTLKTSTTLPPGDTAVIRPFMLNNNVTLFSVVVSMATLYRTYLLLYVPICG